VNSASPRSAIGSPVDGDVEADGDENDAAAVDLVTAALAAAVEEAGIDKADEPEEKKEEKTEEKKEEKKEGEEEEEEEDLSDEEPLPSDDGSVDLAASDHERYDQQLHLVLLFIVCEFSNQLMNLLFFALPATTT